MSRRIPCGNSSVKYPVVVPSALKPPKFQQKLFLSIVLSLRRLPALGAPYTITAPPTPRGGPEVLLEDPLPPFVVQEPHPEHHHEHLQHLGAGWRGGLGAIAVPARSLGAASHQGTPASSPGAHCRSGLCRGSRFLTQKENRNDVTEASAAELLTWSRRGEFTLRPPVYSECFIDTQTESVH